MITPSQCRKIVDDILFDSFGVYRYIFLRQPRMNIVETFFSYQVLFLGEQSKQIVSFRASLVGQEICVEIVGVALFLKFTIHCLEGRPSLLTIVTKLCLNAPSFITYTEKPAVYNEHVISYVSYSISRYISEPCPM